MNVIDLFSGVGGLSLGFEQEGFKVLLAIEKDKDIANSFMKNHKFTKMFNDGIENLNIEKIFENYKNKIDVIIGGPPCQGFSQKGSRKTITDSRNFLFKYYVNVVEYLHPKYFVMENVPNLLTAEKGFFKKEIELLFKNLGYELEIKILNAADFGVPQNRRRAIILGKLGSEKLLIDPPTLIKKNTIWDAISDLAFLDSGEGEFMMDYKFPCKSDYQYLLRGENKVLYNHTATKHSDIALKRLKLIPAEGSKEFLPKEELTKSIYSGTWSRMKKDEISVTITTRFDTPASGRFTHPFLNRAITVREAARLQSFPDNFIFYGSKTSQMKQVGNAVPPILAKYLAKIIKEDMIKINGGN